MDTPGARLRIGIAHGSIRDFGTRGETNNQIAPDRARRSNLDYLALSDWHGTLKADARTWYSGTPETDRFQRDDPGHALLVELRSENEPHVTPIRTGRFQWLTRNWTVNDQTAFDADCDRLLSGIDPSATLLQLSIAGITSLGDRIAMLSRLENDLGHRLRHLTVRADDLVGRPSEEDLATLTVEGMLGAAALKLNERLESGSSEGPSPNVPLSASSSNMAGKSGRESGMKTDIYQSVTQQIISAIEAGAGSYQMPWHSGTGIGAPANAFTGRTYRGINTLLLWAEASRAGYSSGRWATYRQWSEHGCQVRKGERSTLVMLWKPITAREDTNEGEAAPSGRLLARAFQLFNANQVDGYETGVVSELPETARIPCAEAFFQAQPATTWHGSDAAFYDPRADIVSMPAFASFRAPEAFYSVLAHELTHWTGAKRRLDRDLSGRFGSDAYAMEELIAELGAAFTVAHLGLACEPRTDHAPYIASWLRVLAGDPRAIVSAAGKAQAAADYLIGLAGAADATQRYDQSAPVPIEVLA